MSEETKLPWPGYRLREGWRVLAVGEVIADADVLSFTCPPKLEWRRTESSGCIHNNSYTRFRRTDQNATFPPVEPIPAEAVMAEPGDDVRRALEVVSDTITDLRRERDELRKQVNAYEAARVDWMHEAELWSNKVSTLLEDRNGLREEVAVLASQVNRLTAKECEENAVAREWRAKHRPCWVRASRRDPWQPAWLHEWVDEPGSGRWAWAETADGSVASYSEYRLTDHSKAPQQ